MALTTKELNKTKNNPRQITDGHLERLDENLIEYGDLSGIVYNTKLKQLVTGNQRTTLFNLKSQNDIEYIEQYETPQQDGTTAYGFVIANGQKFTYREVEWAKDKHTKAVVLANTHAGAWDFDILKMPDFDIAKDILIDFDILDFEMPNDLDDYRKEGDNTKNTLQAEEDDFEVPEAVEEIKTDIVRGDLIEFKHPDGRYHRLLCGDSTLKEEVERLMDGEKDLFLLTDPPYGINYGGLLKGKGDGNGGSDKHGWKSWNTPTWDKNKPKEDSFIFLLSITKGQIIWGGNYFTNALPPKMGWLIWDKGQRGFSLADGEMAWTSFDNALRIKTYSRAAANKEEKNHPTQKPVPVISWCIEYADRHSKTPIINILDCYLGSGTTMVTSHQLHRHCYGIELDERYCQVITDRMRKLDPDLKIYKNGIEI